MAIVPASSRGADLGQANTWTGNQTAPAFAASGLTGATAASRYVGATASGAPASGTFLLGDFVIDQTAKIYVCTVAGSPGTWVQVGGAGGFTTVTKVTDESVASSTVLQADDELLATFASGKLYVWQMAIVYASPAGAGTPDMKIGIGEDTSISRGVLNATGQNTSDTVANTVLPTDRGNSGIAVFGTAAAKRTVWVTGSHLGAGGTFGLLWAQQTSGVNATTVYNGSVFQYQQVSTVV